MINKKITLFLAKLVFALIIFFQLSALHAKPPREQEYVSSEEDSIGYSEKYEFTNEEVEPVRPKLPRAAAGSERASRGKNSEETSLAYDFAMYLPNRIFDLLDIVRCRAKVGPGAGVGLRVTEFLELYLGSQVSLGLGLPGPRLEPKFPLPIGIESRNGFKLSVIDGTVFNAYEPIYSTSEVGLSLHLLLVGAEVTVDPVEAIDFLAGIFTLDVREDDF
jgi:hypothetical protein